jgi:hypothetical protein
MTNKTCIYCAWRNADSRDHFPPKLVLKEPYPLNLATVPACRECNNGYSMDEEYYRLIIIGLFCFGESAEEIFEGPISRSFDRRPSLEAKMFNSLGVDGEQTYVAPEGRRIERIAQKMAIAIHFIETGFRPSLQSWYATEFFHGEPVPTSSRLVHAPFVESFEPEFRYKFWVRPEDERCALVQITHFNEVHWLVTICPKITDEPYDPNQDWAKCE